MAANPNIGTKSQSFFGYAGLSFEDSFGSGGKPEVYSDIVSDGYSYDNGVQYINTIRSRGRHEGTAGAVEDSGELELAAAPENGLAMLLAGAMGDETFTEITDGGGGGGGGGGSPIGGKHVFETSPLLPSMCVELGVGDIQAVRHTGNGVGSLELEHSSEEYLMASFEMTAKQPELQNSMATPTYADQRPFIFHDGTLSIDGTERSVDCQEITFSLENNLEAQYRMADRTAAKSVVGEREITAEGTLDFSTPDLWEKTLGGAGATKPEKQLWEGSLTAEWISPETLTGGGSDNYSLKIELPRVVIESREANMNEDELVAEDITFAALLDPTTGTDMKATLINGRSTSYL